MAMSLEAALRLNLFFSSVRADLMYLVKGWIQLIQFMNRDVYHQPCFCHHLSNHHHPSSFPFIAWFYQKPRLRHLTPYNNHHHHTHHSLFIIITIAILYDHDHHCSMLTVITLPALPLETQKTTLKAFLLTQHQNQSLRILSFEDRWSSPDHRRRQLRKPGIHFHFPLRKYRLDSRLDARLCFHFLLSHKSQARHV